MDGDRYRRAFDQVRRHLLQVHDIPVELRGDLTGSTGRLDGAEIALNQEQGVDVYLAVMAHLFGHTVQWAVSPKWRTLGQSEESLDRLPSAAELVEIRAYEHEAWEYALGLLHQAGVRDLDRWLSDFSAADFAYLQTAYRLGRPPADFRAFLRPGAPLLTPRAIPPFVPTRCAPRYSF